jgi:superfamily II DNA/RNA helicase
MAFKKLISHAKILQAIEEAGYTEPTPIQEQAIPKILEGRDVQGSAQTGTGKTAAFILPTLERLASHPAKGKKSDGPRVLVLVPTRELAMQVAKEAAKYSKHLPQMKTVCIYGGAPYPIQNRELSRPYEILVATPGRLMDHMERGRISFNRLELLILDEADRMLDMGFIGPVEEIAAKTPANRQTLMFSATFNRNVLNLAKTLLKNPIEISIAAEQTTQENIEQKMYPVDDLSHKYQVLDHFLEDAAITQTIIFTATKRQADTLVEVLLEKGHSADALHGDMNQRQRSRTIEKLRRNQLRILVATDVAARGIDIQSITHVINFDLPNSAEDYVHRIGRTGRAGNRPLHGLSKRPPPDPRHRKVHRTSSPIDRDPRP